MFHGAQELRFEALQDPSHISLRDAGLSDGGRPHS